jgi:hypothetical protein
MPKSKNTALGAVLFAPGIHCPDLLFRKREYQHKFLGQRQPLVVRFDSCGDKSQGTIWGTSIARTHVLEKSKGIENSGT